MKIQATAVDRIFDPQLRQIHQRAERPTRAPVQSAAVTKLADGHRAQGAIVSARLADRVQSLLRKAGAVEDQYPAPLDEHLRQATPDPLGTPRRMRDEVLKRLIRHRLGDAASIACIDFRSLSLNTLHEVRRASRDERCPKQR
jgi:hypothetical protein